MTTDTAPGAVAAPSRRTAWIVGGALGLVSLAAAGTIALRSTLPAPVAAAPTEAGAKEAPRAAAKATDRRAAAATPAAAPICSDCGVVESVRSIKRKGQGTGIGAVAGGVVGAALGNQVGKGNGRSAMTVLGAVGGGVAGHEIEKQARSVTVHEVRVRMDDGSLRTIEQSQPAHAGDRVIVQGNMLKPAAGTTTSKG
jgi:outer membrane lipoprotein SlyB